MNGSMTIYNFIISGTLSFGNEILDRGAVIADIEDVRTALDMSDASGEILGFFKDGFYNDESALKIAEKFNSAYSGNTDEFAPVMKTLSQQGSMGQYVKMSDYLDKLYCLYIYYCHVACFVECRPAWRPPPVWGNRDQAGNG